MWHLPYNMLLEASRRLGPVRTPRLGPAKGLYSEYELVEQRQIPGRVVYSRQESPDMVPGSLRDACGLRQTGCQPWPFFWSHRRGARLVGRSLALMNEKKRLCAEAVFYQHCLPAEPSYRYLGLPKAVELEGNWTSVVSRWGYGFHHWWMDVLPRLAVLSEFPRDTRILVYPELENYQRETLELLGLDARVRPTAEPHLLVENYFFSSPTAMTGCWNPYAVAWLRGCFLKNMDKDWTPPRRFYIRRIGRHRGLVNESDVIDFLQKRGWTILDLEAMPVRRQIRLFADAEAVCGLHGAAFTNLLWSRPGCKALEICASGYLNGVYEGIAGCVHVEHHHVICPADSGFHARVDMNQFRQKVELMERDL
jgi:capsular polysaccharide biosynthesis protein